ncbi:phosphodiesterase [Bermanella marisrubri]|nr:phosphodiesterase [Bermanella marisrubri]
MSLVAAADNHPASEINTGTTIKMPLSNKASLHAKDLPQRGATKMTVEKRFGVPIKKHPAKGTPPIERWDYENFSVYFETNAVIHSVDKRNK